MRLWTASLFLAFVGPGLAQDAEDPDDADVPEEEFVEGEEEEIAGEGQGRVQRGRHEGPAVDVRLDGGLLQVRSGEEWKEATLDGLSTALGAARDEYEAAMRRKGESGREERPGGVTVSKLGLSLTVHPDTPWLHLQWLMTMAAEQRIARLALSDGKRSMRVLLPGDRGICGIGLGAPEPPLEVKASIHVVARKEEAGLWDGKPVARPTEFRYRYGPDRETADVAEVVKWVRGTKGEVEAMPEKPRLTGEIKAGHKVPFGKVLDVMEAFVDSGLEAVEFYGHAIPGAEIRALPRLPYPLRNYGAAG